VKFDKVAEFAHKALHSESDHFETSKNRWEIHVLSSTGQRHVTLHNDMAKISVIQQNAWQSDDPWAMLVRAGHEISWAELEVPSQADPTQFTIVMRKIVIDGTVFQTLEEAAQTLFEEQTAVA